MATLMEAINAVRPKLWAGRGPRVAGPGRLPRRRRHHRPHQRAAQGRDGHLLQGHLGLRAADRVAGQHQGGAVSGQPSGLRARTHLEQEQQAAYYRQQKDIARINEDIRGAEHHARTIEANTIDYAVRAKAAKIARPAVVRKKKLERLLESTEYIEKPARKWGLAVEFTAPPQGARDVLVIDDADPRVRRLARS